MYLYWQSYTTGARRKLYEGNTNASCYRLDDIKTDLLELCIDRRLYYWHFILTTCDHTYLYILGPVVQSWVSANSWLSAFLKR